MGISMIVLLCADEQIHSFHRDPNLLREFLHKTPSGGDCYLADFWDALDFLITQGPEVRGLPMTALKVGDVEFPSADDDTHAIFRHTARAFAGELQRLSETTLRGRFDLAQLIKAKIYPIRPWLFPQYEEDTFHELLGYYRRLLNVTEAATTQKVGLLFCRYEDL